MSFNLLDWLEWLARYGIIDIVFGVGILGYLRQLFRSPTVEHIPGVEIHRRFRTDGGYLEIEVMNLSSQPLYIYKAHFNRRYETLGVPWNWFVVAWRTKFPKAAATEKMNLQGEYLLIPHNQAGNRVQWVLLEFRNSAFYTVHIENGAEFIAREQDSLNRLISKRECGTLTLYCVHGTSERILRTRI
jgi:hypothetical protein